MLKDKDGYNVDFGGKKSCSISPANLAQMQCYFPSGARKAHAAFEGMLSFSFLFKKSQETHLRSGEVRFH